MSHVNSRLQHNVYFGLFHTSFGKDSRIIFTLCKSKSSCCVAYCSWEVLKLIVDILHFSEVLISVYAYYKRKRKGEECRGCLWAIWATTAGPRTSRSSSIASDPSGISFFSIRLRSIWCANRPFAKETVVPARILKLSIRWKTWKREGLRISCYRQAQA